MGYKVSAAGEAAGEGVTAKPVEAGATAPVVADGDQKPEPAAENPFGDSGDKAAEGEIVAAEDSPVEN